MSATQLSFSLRVSSGVKTVHLLGSWDKYVRQLPLSKDRSSSKGTWKGTFRFQNTTIEPGQRYWYYYIIDGYHVSHNPSEPSTREPTTGRELNILDVPKSRSSSSSQRSSKASPKHHSSSPRHSSSPSSKDKYNRSRGPISREIPKGRPLSVSQIQAPVPVAPRGIEHILNSEDSIDDLVRRFGYTGLQDYPYDTKYIDNDLGALSSSPFSSSSSSSSLSSRSYSSSPNSSVSGYSTPGSNCSSCMCERYGITRKGERVRLDCGGSRCGYCDDCSDCSSDDGDDGDLTRRNGIFIRH